MEYLREWTSTMMQRRRIHPQSASVFGLIVRQSGMSTSTESLPQRVGINGSELKSLGSSKPEKPSNKIVSLDVPTELSAAEYADLLEQIRSDFSVEECQAELLDAARYNDIDVVRGILRVHHHSSSSSSSASSSSSPLLLHHQDATTGHSALHMAAANGHTAIVELLLSVEQQQNQSSADPPLPPPLIRLVNAAGNTALHWAAANGQAAAVALLLQQEGADVLLKNGAGRSALTEGFASNDTAVIQALLEHESASEERLVATSTAGGGGGAHQHHPDSVTHQLVFGTTFGEQAKIPLQIRELVMAKTDQDSILGQSSPDQDTTGFGIWASSLVTAQWMSALVVAGGGSLSSKEQQQQQLEPQLEAHQTVLELGAGCGVPGLVVASSDSSRKVYVTDFNETTVANLEHNIELNHRTDNCHALAMNWQDSDTWPKEPIDIVIGSDLIYQCDMVPLLLRTLHGLRPRRFLYAAPAEGRQGHKAFLRGMMERFHKRSAREAPAAYKANPLQSQDEEECFVHFHELVSISLSANDRKFMLYDFLWKDDE